jgi:predicted HAD superfamily Cof-like phosphohydrolase
MFSHVLEFHRIFNLNIGLLPYLPHLAERELRRVLLIEECEEFCKAYDEDDMVEMADGLADICYIIAGTCISYGISPEGRYMSPYEDKLIQMDIFIHTNPKTLVQEELAKYMVAERDDDLEKVRTLLVGMMDIVFGISLHLGIPINEVFLEVHRSNLSKVEEDGKPRYREDGKLLKGSRFSPPSIKPILDKYRNNIKTY